MTLGAALLLLAGCSNSGGTPESTGTTGTTPAGDQAKPFKVALLTPGPVSDAGWNAMAYKGLQAIKSELGAEVNNQEATGSQKLDAMRSYAQDGYTLVFGHGFEYNDPAAELGPAFPDTFFVSSSGGKTGPNVGAFRFYLEQGFYLAGYTAGLMTKSGKVAMIGGDRVPSIASTFKAFAAGAKAARPDVVVIEKFTGNGQDVAAAKQATLAAIGEGADFVIHQANAAAQGVFDACKEKNVKAFGANLDQNSNESGVVLASAIINAEPAFVALAKDVKEGKYKGEIRLTGMAEKAIDYVFNPTMVDQVPAEIQEKVETERARILSGALTVPKDEF